MARATARADRKKLDPISKTPVELAMDLLRREGGRASNQRRLVLQSLIGAGRDHRTAEQITAEVQSLRPDIHETTVYRTLERFEQLGLAFHVHTAHGPARWHLARSKPMYLSCSVCGNVLETDPKVGEKLRDDLRRRLGFQLDFQHVALTGICGPCAMARSDRERHRRDRPTRT